MAPPAKNQGGKGTGRKAPKKVVPKKKIRDTRPENFFSTVKKIHAEEHGQGKNAKRLDSMATGALAGVAVENARKFAMLAHRMAQQSKKVTVMPRHIQAAINMVVHNKQAREKINSTITKANETVAAVIDQAKRRDKPKRQKGQKSDSIQQNLKDDKDVALHVSIRKTLRLMRQECGTMNVSVRGAVICAVAIDQILKNLLSTGHAKLEKDGTVHGERVTEAMKKKVTLTLPFMQSRVQDNEVWSGFFSAGVVGGAPPVARRLFWGDKLTDEEKQKKDAEKNAKKAKQAKKNGTKPAAKQDKANTSPNTSQTPADDKGTKSDDEPLVAAEQAGGPPKAKKAPKTKTSLAKKQSKPKAAAAKKTKTAQAEGNRRSKRNLQSH